MISPLTIQAIKDRANLAEIIGESVSLKRQGGNSIGLCPFHTEKTPSFHVRESEGYYHCFGCGVSGTAIDFVMRMRGLSFPEAVEELASRLGIEVVRDGSYSKDTTKTNKQVFFKVNRSAFEFFKDSLKKADPIVHKYMTERGLSARAVDAFGIGFSPKSWNGLREFLCGKKIDDDISLSAGLLRRSSKGDLYDTFRGRLMFPVFIDERRIAGFGARVIPTLLDPDSINSSPKYLNSSESAVYEKNKILYGLPQNFSSIREQGELYLVEGYMDVIGLWQQGVQNVVATCGTSVTENHIRRLSRVARKVSILFDGDHAGRMAAGKTFVLFLNSGIDAMSVFLPEGEDPDTFATRHGKGTSDAIRTLPKIPLLNSYIDMIIEKHGSREVRELGAAAKGQVCEEVCERLSQVKNVVEQSELVQLAALKLMVETKELIEMINGSTKDREKKESISNPSVETKTTETNETETKETELASKRLAISELPRVDRELLYTVMGKREMASELLSNPDICLGVRSSTLLFVEGLNAIVCSESSSHEEQKERIKTLLNEFGESWVSHWRQAYEMGKDPAVKLEQLYYECCQTFKKNKLIEVLRGIDLVISGCSDEVEKIRLHQEKLGLSRKLNELHGTQNK